jgi:hypothetical protein
MCRNQSLLKKLLWSVSPGLDPLEGAEIWAESFPFFLYCFTGGKFSISPEPPSIGGGFITEFVIHYAPTGVLNVKKLLAPRQP